MQNPMDAIFGTENTPTGKILTIAIVGIGVMMILNNLKNKIFWMGILSLILLQTSVVIKKDQNPMLGTAP